MWPARSEAFPHTICKLTGSRQTNWRELCQSDGLISVYQIYGSIGQKRPRLRERAQSVRGCRLERVQQDKRIPGDRVGRTEKLIYIWVAASTV